MSERGQGMSAFWRETIDRAWKTAVQILLVYLAAPLVEAMTTGRLEWDWTTAQTVLVMALGAGLSVLMSAAGTLIGDRSPNVLPPAQSPSGTSGPSAV